MSSELIKRVVMRSSQGGWRIYSIERKANYYYLYCRAGNSYEATVNGTKTSMGSSNDEHLADKWFDFALERALSIGLVTTQMSGLEELAMQLVDEDE